MLVTGSVFDPDDNQQEQQQWARDDPESTTLSIDLFGGSFRQEKRLTSGIAVSLFLRINHSRGSKHTTV